MPPRFCLDSNVFIQAKNGPYGLDIVPSFWKFLDEQADAEAICSPRMVYEELVSGKDDLADRVRDRKDAGIFVEPSEEVQVVFSTVADYVKATYKKHQGDDFLDGADPWIIAQAKVEGSVVVTHEKRVVQDSEKVKIPNVCDQFGVKHVDTYEMLRVLGAHF